MTWDLLNIIGTMAFAISGVIVALEEKYDLFGVYLLGFTTAFGGGIVRNLLLGLPVSDIWEQNTLFIIAFVTMTVIFFIPNNWIQGWVRWLAFFDAIGLGAFAVQGAMFAALAGHPLIAIIVAGVLTGVGGGIIRDILARRKPLVLHQEIYAMWAVLGALTVGLGIFQETWQLVGIVAVIVVLRMLSVIYKWQLPAGPDW
ncbi:trimeric intracellular cation channel family protein [Bacillaceae bacterium W0354]